jgi:hypothetical protein
MRRRHQERHWSTISLGIITMATAAIGGAVFAIDLEEIVTSLPTYFLMLFAIVIYFWVLSLGGRAMFATPVELNRQGKSKREATRLLYVAFIVELFAIAGLVITQANTSLLQLLPISP